MDQSSIFKIGILVILIGLSGLFSASETALMSINKIKLKKLEDSRRSRALKDLMSNTSKLLSTILFGNNLVNIYASSLTTSLAIILWGNESVALVTIVLTIIILIFGEIIPKTLAKKNAEKFSLSVALIIKWLSVILTPIVFLLEKISNLFVKITGGNVDEDDSVTEEEIKDIIEVGSVEGALEEEEKQMIYNVFEFGDMKAKDVMTHRTEIVAVEKDATYEEIMEAFLEEQFSRIPVYDESKDNIIGVLHVKDFVFKNITKENFEMNKVMKQPYFTYKYASVSDLFNDMRKERAAMAFVMNEYGGLDGIVTMEDLIEEIVGDIEDEFDDEEVKIEKINDNEYIVDGDMELDELLEECNIDILSNIVDEEYFSDTIGGLVMEILGGIPKEKVVIEVGNYKIKVEKATRNGISRVRIMLNTNEVFE
ncbi:integral membrane protein [Clostridium bornimense]|uniref:Integral membrane protein n=1 Tax=Clostridium bornimense TaxID=1216932 RepID=W6RZV7_9CLOT|nr:hemolysin family protein [Clostridium bornimense]CDM69149.1 integral membrane protein [Clostridium bornimense]